MVWKIKGTESNLHPVIFLTGFCASVIYSKNAWFVVFFLFLPWSSCPDHGRKMAIHSGAATRLWVQSPDPFCLRRFSLLWLLPTVQKTCMWGKLWTPNFSEVCEWLFVFNMALRWTNVTMPLPYDGWQWTPWPWVQEKVGIQDGWIRLLSGSCFSFYIYLVKLAFCKPSSYGAQQHGVRWH